MSKGVFIYSIVISVIYIIISIANLFLKAKNKKEFNSKLLKFKDKEEE